MIMPWWERCEKRCEFMYCECVHFIYTFRLCNGFIRIVCRVRSVQVCCMCFFAWSRSSRPFSINMPGVMLLLGPRPSMTMCLRIDELRTHITHDTNELKTDVYRSNLYNTYALFAATYFVLVNICRALFAKRNREGMLISVSCQLTYWDVI